MIKIILADLDGTLNDFFGYAFQILDDKFPNRITKEEYLANPSFNMAEKFKISDKEFWATIDKGRFWYNIPQLPWTRQLYEFIGRFAPVVIASSPSENPDCIAQKLDWLDKHLGVSTKDCMFGSKKHLMANSETLLIDDYPSNCDKFIAAGGHAICVPSTWNTKNLQYNDILERIVRHPAFNK